MPTELRRAIQAAGLLDYDSAADYLCTSPRKIRHLWETRQLAGVKVGRSVRFTKADLDAFILRRRVSEMR